MRTCIPHLIDPAKPVSVTFLTAKSHDITFSGYKSTCQNRAIHRKKMYIFLKAANQNSAFCATLHNISGVIFPVKIQEMYFLSQKINKTQAPLIASIKDLFQHSFFRNHQRSAIKVLYEGANKLVGGPLILQYTF